MMALMLGEPKYGYQLKREAGWMTGEDPLHNNIVYPMLRRFLDDGLVSKKAVPGERGQTRQQYALTAQGRRVFFERMNSFTDDDAASDDAFRLRLGIFEELKAESREAILAKREQYLERRDQRLENLQGQMELGRFGGEIVRYMRKQIATERDWIRHLRRMEKNI